MRIRYFSNRLNPTAHLPWGPCAPGTIENFRRNKRVAFDSPMPVIGIAFVEC